MCESLRFLLIYTILSASPAYKKWDYRNILLKLKYLEFGRSPVPNDAIPKFETNFSLKKKFYSNNTGFAQFSRLSKRLTSEIKIIYYEKSANVKNSELIIGQNRNYYSASRKMSLILMIMRENIGKIHHRRSNAHKFHYVLHLLLLSIINTYHSFGSSEPIADAENNPFLGSDYLVKEGRKRNDQYHR
ncbi:unnamed protein product [Rhizophagus irregularis]|nr:unnamed protein product [Rhizophagus irregularis]